ncbi:MAG: 6-phosphogluconolactonase [Pseudomonas fluorescens]|nr:MAG: 6-phosphogluconolactonase [Pseudomonas fluorescens]
MRMPTHVILPSATSLAAHVAEWLTAKAEASTGTFSICLSGGSTPKALYSLLATQPFASRMPWNRIHLFFGDERFVPYTHADSNFRMVKEALLDHVPLSPANIHPFPILETPEASASAYATTLQQFYGHTSLAPEKPLFDVTFLGLGEDGHTASLFPNTAALDERTAWATAVIGAKPEPRLTLTYPVLEHSATIAFLTAGASKTEMLTRAMAHDASIPAGRIAPLHNLIWFTDTAATGA